MTLGVIILFKYSLRILLRNNESFQQFLERQQDHLIKKGEDIKKITEESKGTHKPEITKKSRVILKKKGSFLQRLEQDLDKRKNTDKNPNNNEFSFKPRISTVSKNMKRRSWAELSTGDLMRKEALMVLLI